MTQYFVTQGSKLYLRNPIVSPMVAVVAAQLQGLDGIGGQKSSIKLDNFDSPGYMENAPGLVDPGKPSGNMVLDFQSPAHQLLDTLLGMGTGAETEFFYAAADGVAAPTIVADVLVPPTTGSPLVAERSGWMWNGFVIEFTITAQVNNVMLAKFGSQASGKRKMIVKGQPLPA